MNPTSRPTATDARPHEFTSVDLYHRDRPGHSSTAQPITCGLLLGDKHRVSGELAEWNIMFHPNDDTPTIGDTVAHRVVHDIASHPAERASFILLAEDMTLVDDPDQWSRRIAEHQTQGTLSDIEYLPAEVDEQTSVGSRPERIFNDPDTRETWWRSRVTRHRSITITTRIKTLQDTDGSVTAQDVAISISDGTSPRYFSIPVAVLDQVVAALDFARYDAEAVSLTLQSRDAR